MAIGGGDCSHTGGASAHDPDSPDALGPEARQPRASVLVMHSDVPNFGGAAMRLIRCVRILSVSCSIAALASVSASGLQAAKPAGDSARYPCRDVHTFDFWVGDFDASPWNGPATPARGRLHNTREYEGCVIVERWDGANGSAGMSVSFYDVNRRAWRMVWNGDDNQSNDFEGTYRDGAMRFEGWVLDGAGKRVLARNVLEDVSPETIRHVYSISADGGKTWEVKSDGRFVRRGSAP
jgi:hypothetical protein